MIYQKAATEQHNEDLYLHSTAEGALGWGWHTAHIQQIGTDLIHD